MIEHNIFRENKTKKTEQFGNRSVLNFLKFS
jgi:hypothetical protein